MISYHRYYPSDGVIYFETYRNWNSVPTSIPLTIDHIVLGDTISFPRLNKSFPFNKKFEYNSVLESSTIVEGTNMTKYYAPKKKQHDGTLFIRVTGDRRMLFAVDTKEKTTLNPVNNPDWKEITADQAMDCLETNTPITTLPTYRSETRGVIVIEEMVNEHLLNAATYRSETRGVIVIEEMVNEHLLNAARKSLNRLDNEDVQELVDLVLEVGKRGLTL